MKPKSKATLDIALANPHMSQQDAYLATHKTASAPTARTNASKLFNSPAAQIYLSTHVDRAQKKIVKLVDSEKEEIALKASQDIMDRTHGKAITTAHSINLNISIEEALEKLI